MVCMEFEDLLAAYAEMPPVERRRVDAHLQVCPACRSWLETLSEIDIALASNFEHVKAPATLAPAVRRRAAQLPLVRVSAVPEILDFVGWLAAMGATGLLAYFLIPPSWSLTAPVVFAIFGVVLGVALSATVWELRSSES